MTQKERIAELRDFAADLGALLTIRKNMYGEYETRIRMSGSRAYVLNYLADSFEDALSTANTQLTAIRDAQRYEGERRKAQHYRDLDAALKVVQTMLNLVGCRVEIDPLDTVTMYSPRTGSHSLNMTFGVRPVSDLFAHACGFAEQQTHVK